MIYRIALLITAALLIALSGCEKTQEKPKQQAPQATTTQPTQLSEAEKEAIKAEAEKQALEYAKTLKGIERHYVFMSGKTPGIWSTVILMNYHQQPIPEAIQKFIENRHLPGMIETLDRKAGYMKTVCLGCESTSFLTYWTNPGQPDLVADVSRGCGPVCEDRITFYHAGPDGMTKLDTTSIIGKVTQEMFLAEGGDPNVFNQDAYELLFHLPQKGTSIRVTLDAGGPNFKGNCMDLLWNKGTFTQGPIKTCK